MRFVIFFFPFMILFPAEIPQGTHVLLRMVNAISTRTAREGDRVYLRTASPIVVNGQFVVPVDSYAEGVVSHSVRSGRVKGRAELGIHVNSFTLPTGETLRVSPQLSSIDSAGTEQKVETTKENEIRQGGSKGQDAERIAVTSGSGAAIGGLADRSWKGAGIGAGIGGGVGLATVLLTRGREVDLPQGTTLDVVFTRPVTVE
jgi:type IV secretion system protein VirB10